MAPLLAVAIKPMCLLLGFDTRTPSEAEIVHIPPPSILCLISKLGKSSKLVFLGFVPNTTEPLQNYYGSTLWDLKHPKRPRILNGQIIKLILI